MNKLFEAVYPWIMDGMTTDPSKAFDTEELRTIARLIKHARVQPDTVIMDADEKVSAFIRAHKLDGKPEEVKLGIVDLQKFFKELLELLRRED